VATPQAPRRRLGWIAACGAALTGAALGAAGFVVWPQVGGDFDAGRSVRAERAGEAEATSRTPAVGLPRAAAYAGDAPAASVAPSPETRPGSLSAAALASRVEVVDRIEPSPDPTGAPAEPPAPPPPAVATAAAVSESSPRLAAAPVAVAPAAAATRSEASAVASGPSRPPPPAPSKLVRAFVPDVLVVRTVWHPAAERRVAEIQVEGRPEPLLLHEGDAVGPLVVREIEPSGVLFLHDDVELRRRVGMR
jgi:hypothetical protein